MILLRDHDKIVSMKKKIAILGSTGSIGTQTLEVIDNYPDLFEVEVLTAKRNHEMLIGQAYKYVPKKVVIADEAGYSAVKAALKGLPVEVASGMEALSEAVSMESIDLVVSSLVGIAGLLPTLTAIKSGKDIALANKETLVVAGEIITQLAAKHHVNIYPVDSEHSAIFQCLAGEGGNAIEKIYLTASGGPFRKKTVEELQHVTCREALNHPNWCMGNKVTIDSASLMNKGLEAIEAKWLFNLKAEQVDVIIHPQSIIHSIVQFEDGSMKAQMGLPDMKLPIQYALTYPKRLKTNFERFNFFYYPELTFEPPDLKKFRNLAIAFEAMKVGGNAPCVMNAANEIVVEAFLNEKVRFVDMPGIIEHVMARMPYIKNPSFEDLLSTNCDTRIYTEEIIVNKKY
jgi:1-deoxy-D-xylulose-5-phosphate reductoisomerase